MTRIPRLLAPAAVLGAGTALMQYHAIGWWSDHVNPATGWAWSVTLEAVALWLWYRPSRGAQAFGLIGTLLVLAGPLHQVATPVLEELRQAEHTAQAHQAKIELQRERVADLRQTLDRVTANSRERTGWLPAIESARADLEAARGKLSEMLSARPAGGESLAWSVYAVVILQGLGLLVVAISNVVAIRAVSRDLHAEPESVSQQAATFPAIETPGETVKGMPAPVSMPVETLTETGDQTETGFQAASGETAEAGPGAGADKPEPAAGKPDPFTIRRLQRELADHLEREALSAAAFCEANGISKKNLSLFRNHEERQREGKQTAPVSFIHQLETLFLGNMETVGEG